MTGTTGAIWGNARRWEARLSRPGTLAMPSVPNPLTGGFLEGPGRSKSRGSTLGKTGSRPTGYARITPLFRALSRR